MLTETHPPTGPVLHFECLRVCLCVCLVCVSVCLYACVPHWVCVCVCVCVWCPQSQRTSGRAVGRDTRWLRGTPGGPTPWPTPAPWTLERLR